VERDSESVPKAQDVQVRGRLDLGEDAWDWPPRLLRDKLKAEGHEFLDGEGVEWEVKWSRPEKTAGAGV